MFIVPLVIVDLLVFVVYALDRNNMEARMVRKAWGQLLLHVADAAHV